MPCTQPFLCGIHSTHHWQNKSPSTARQQRGAPSNWHACRLANRGPSRLSAAPHERLCPAAERNSVPTRRANSWGPPVPAAADREHKLSTCPVTSTAENVSCHYPRPIFVPHSSHAMPVAQHHR